MTNKTTVKEIKNNRQPTYEIDTAILNRWSSRSFIEKDVPQDVLFSLFEAARWAPSAFNIQPWRFIIARSKEDKEKFHSFISEFNLSWCDKAPALALIISKVDSERGPNRSHDFDAGAAWGLLAVEASKKGLATHPMTGIDFDKARKLLQIPSDYAINALIAIGYRGPKEQLNDVLQEREQPSNRLPLNEIVFEGKFEGPVML